MSTHTPGPWTAEEGNGINHIIGENVVLAQVSVWPIKADESEANARLIAAAPLMKDLLQHVPHNKQFALHRTIGRVAGCPGCNAEAILRDVEGESNA